MSRTALLDVNVPVALFDPDHVHHELAHDWFADHQAVTFDRSIPLRAVIGADANDLTIIEP